MARKLMILGALSVGLFLLAGTALAQGNPTIDWWVIGGGGGSASNGGTSLDGTIGQPVVGSNTSGSTQLDSGFWGGAVGGLDEYKVYLPLILRQSY
jgi:hypothetical protein